MRPNSRPGFTLIEVLLAVALIAVFGGIAVIHFPRMIDAAQKPDPETAVVDAIRELRIEALRRSQTVQIGFDSDPESGQSFLLANTESNDLSRVPLPVEITAIEFLPDPVYTGNRRPAEATPNAEIAPTGRYGFGGVRIELKDHTSFEFQLDPLGGGPVRDEDSNTR